MTSRVAFLFFTEPNFSVVRPIMRALAAHSTLDPILIIGFDYEAVQLGIPPWHPEDVPYLRLPSLDEEIPPTVEQAIPKKNFDSLEMTWLSETFNRLEGNGLVARLERLAKELDSWLDQNRPSLLVLPEETDYCRGRLASMLPKAKAIPKLVIFPRYYQLFRDYPMVVTPRADHYLVCSKGLADRLRSKGIQEFKVSLFARHHISGTPAVPPPPIGNRRLLLLLQGLPWENRWVSDVVDVARERGWQLLIRPHPKRSAEGHAFHKLLSQEPHVLWIDSRQSLSRTITLCDGVIGQSSSAFLQALSLHRRLLIAHYGPGEFPLWLEPDEKWISVFSGKTSLRLLLSRLDDQRTRAPLPLAFCGESAFADKAIQIMESLI